MNINSQSSGQPTFFQFGAPTPFGSDDSVPFITNMQKTNDTAFNFTPPPSVQNPSESNLSSGVFNLSLLEHNRRNEVTTEKPASNSPLNSRVSNTSLKEVEDSNPKPIFSKIKEALEAASQRNEFVSLKANNINSGQLLEVSPNGLVCPVAPPVVHHEKISEDYEPILKVFEKGDKIDLNAQTPRTVNIDDVDIFTQSTFKELIDTRLNHNLPYYIAFIEEENDEKSSKIHFTVDASSLMQSYFSNNNITNPLTRRPIKDIRIYKISKGLKSCFKFFCNKEDLEIKQQHYPKHILAADLDIDKTIRGTSAYYLSQCYKNGLNRDNGETIIKKNITKAVFWMERSANDEYYSAFFTLSLWSFTGTGVPKDRVKAYRYMTKAKALTPPSEKKLHDVINNTLDKWKQYSSTTKDKNQYWCLCPDCKEK